MPKNKKKIINDPVYGFINIPEGLIFDLIEHRYFQRLRRIRQLGLTYLVYPGAIHSRFQHSIGAMHLTSLAIEVLRGNGQEITEAEAEGLMIAVLLHDIGHTPFSHGLEKNIFSNLSHEEFSLKFMNILNEEFNNKLSLAISIFKGEYKKKFLHQLVSGQLDMDRLDYLRRDSFFTGVHEGTIGSDRIIQMLKVVDDKLVVEAKGIYSIEKFLIARRLMYWQVYLHKTALAAELLLVKIFERVKELYNRAEKFACSEMFADFFESNFKNDKELIEKYSQLDDYDIYWVIKQWINCDDKILSELSANLIYRKLPKIILSKEKFDEDYINTLKNKLQKQLKISEHEVKYFLFNGSVSNNAYSNIDDRINILYKDEIIDISDASDILNLSILSKVIKKHYVCTPKNL